MQKHAVILGAFAGVGNDRVGFVNQCRIAMVATHIRMLFESMHDRAIAGFDDFLRRIRLNMKQPVVVSFILHGPNLLCFGAVLVG